MTSEKFERYKLWLDEKLNYIYNSGTNVCCKEFEINFQEELEAGYPETYKFWEFVAVVNQDKLYFASPSRCNAIGNMSIAEAKTKYPKLLEKLQYTVGVDNISNVYYNLVEKVGCFICHRCE